MFNIFNKKKHPPPQDTIEAQDDGITPTDPAFFSQKPSPVSLCEEQTDKTPGLFSQLQSAVKTTQSALVGKIKDIFQTSELTEDTLDNIEDILIRADVGLDTAVSITNQARTQLKQFKTTDALLAFLKQAFTEILSPVASACDFPYQDNKLNIYLVVGVNGTGKTTTIGKIAHHFRKKDCQVVIGAGDTFRAAAVEQLGVWANRANAIFVSGNNSNTGKATTDPAAVMFEAVTVAKQNNAQVLLLDTAGRLQNKHNLMTELQKVYQVIQREMPENAVLNTLLVVDATTGQNALKQATVFKSCVNLSGVILTKLDGSAKGGIVFTIAKEHHLPIQLIGVGEGIEDIEAFDPNAFVEALFA
ncbi:MAG: signal recognition particle-docking protein FtsY [Cyanobacteria bacterium P01_H01_bin.74]